MNLIGWHKAKAFMKRYNQSRTVLDSWRQVVENTSWATPHDVQKTFPTADLIRGERLSWVFDVRGNKYRVIARVNYEAQEVLIREVLTHDEYEQKYC